MPFETQDSVEVSGEIRDRDGKLLFRLHTENLKQLERIVRRGINEVSRHGLETGGLMIGTMPTANDPVATLVDFVPVAIKYRFGPGYLLCDADEAAFKEALARVPPGGDSKVIGYFRSHIGADTDVRLEDRLLLHHLFGNRRSLFILILAGKSRPSVLHFHLREGEGELEQIHKVPLAELLGAQAHADEAPATLAVPPQTGIASRQQKLLIASGILIVALATFSIGRLTIGAPKRDAVPVGLSVRKRGTSVELRWNATSPIVKNATGGSLIIVDSANAQRVELSAAELRAGRYEFKPARGNLTFQIMLRQRDHTFAGEIRSLSIDLPESLAAAPRAMAPAAAAKPMLARTIAMMRVVIPPVKGKTPPKLAHAKVERSTFVLPPVEEAPAPGIGIHVSPSFEEPPPLDQATARPFSAIPAKPFSAPAEVKRGVTVIPPGVRALIRWVMRKEPPKD